MSDWNNWWFVYVNGIRAAQLIDGAPDPIAPRLPFLLDDEITVEYVDARVLTPPPSTVRFVIRLLAPTAPITPIYGDYADFELIAEAIDDQAFAGANRITFRPREFLSGYSRAAADALPPLRLLFAIVEDVRAEDIENLPELGPAKISENLPVKLKIENLLESYYRQRSMNVLLMQQKLAALKVVDGASRKNSINGDWLAVKRDDAYVTIEATTAPDNSPEEWAAIEWKGECVPVDDHPNQRRVSRASAAQFEISARLGDGKDSVTVWIVWAQIIVLTSGTRPPGSAPFFPPRDGTDALGAVTYLSATSSPLDEKSEKFVQNMAAAGKVAIVATIEPPGVRDVASDEGWMIQRARITGDWIDGVPTAKSVAEWTSDTSPPQILRLHPDSASRIYDIDAPDIAFGKASFETYNNFRQWVEWNGEMCSDAALWHWQAQWRLDADPAKQIKLCELGANVLIAIPAKPKL